MLKINTDQEFMSLKPMASLNSPLSEKIFGDYSLIEAEFSPEDLLFLITNPEDIYLEDGSVTNLYNENNLTNIKNVRIDTINNLVNRLININENNLSYKDTVYIEATLRKMGITNVSTFISEVKKLAQTEENTENLFNLYKDNLYVLKSVYERAERAEKKSDKKSEEEKSEKVKNYYLHNDVFKRLDTANTVRELNLIYTKIPSKENEISKEEMDISESAKLSKEIVLNNIKNYVQNENNPLIYRSYNIYEEGNRLSNNSGREEIVENMISAVLLNYVNKAVTVKNNAKNVYSNSWLDFRKTFYDSSNDTFERIEKNRTSQNLFMLKEENLENRYEKDVNEKNILKNIVKIYESSKTENSDVLENIDVNTLTYLKSLNTYKEDFETIKNATTIDLSKDIKKYVNAKKVASVNVNNFYDTGNVETTFETTVENNETVINEEEKNLELKKALDIINSQNLETLTKLSNINIKNEVKKSKTTIDKSQVIRDSLKLLENPEANITYLEAKPIIEKSESYIESIESLMSEETKEIFKLLGLYKANEKEARERANITNPAPELMTKELELINRTNEASFESINEKNSEAFIETNRIIEKEVKKENAATKEDKAKENSQNINLIHKDENIVNEETEKTLYERTVSKVSEDEEKLIKETILKEKTIPERFLEESSKKTKSTRKKVELIHKDTKETIDKDEVLEEIKKQNSTVKKEIQDEIKTSINQTNTTQNTYNFADETVTTVNSQNVERYVIDGVRESMDEICEKVYGRLEKKLNSEKKRRGF